VTLILLLNVAYMISGMKYSFQDMYVTYFQLVSLQ